LSGCPDGSLFEEEASGMLNKSRLVTNIASATDIPEATIESMLAALAGEVQLVLSGREISALPRIRSFLPDHKNCPRFTPARALKKND